MEIGPVVSSSEYPGMKNGGTSYNMSQPVLVDVSFGHVVSVIFILLPDEELSFGSKIRISK